MALEDPVTTSAPPAGTPVKRRIIDADAHIDPPHEAWREYLPERLRDLAPYIEEGDEHDWVVFEGKRKPMAMISNQAGRQGKDYKMFGKRSEMRASWLCDQRLEDMTTDGIDASVLFANAGSLPTSNPELYIESFRAYNRWVWDFCGADRKRLVPVAWCPMRDVDESIAIIREASKLGFRSVNIPAFPQSRDGVSTSATVKAINVAQGAALAGDPGGKRSYRDPEYDVLFQTLSELDMTFTMHLGGRIPRFGEKEHFLADLVMSKLAMAEPVAILIYNCIFQKYPNLRMAIVESGVGWLAWMAEYMDATWERQRFWTDSKLEEKPSTVMDRNIFASYIHDRTGVLMRNQPGGRNIMWSSDYPHSETSFPHSQEVIAKDFEGVPEEDIAEIVCHRASRVYSVG